MSDAPIVQVHGTRVHRERIWMELDYSELGRSIRAHARELDSVFDDKAQIMLHDGLPHWHRLVLVDHHKGEYDWEPSKIASGPAYFMWQAADNIDEAIKVTAEIAKQEGRK